jgi:hypothetical protein
VECGATSPGVGPAFERQPRHALHDDVAIGRPLHIRSKAGRHALVDRRTTGYAAQDDSLVGHKLHDRRWASRASRAKADGDDGGGDEGEAYQPESPEKARISSQSRQSMLRGRPSACSRRQDNALPERWTCRARGVTRGPVIAEDLTDSGNEPRARARRRRSEQVSSLQRIQRSSPAQVEFRKPACSCSYPRSPHSASQTSSRPVATRQRRSSQRGTRSGRCCCTSALGPRAPATRTRSLMTPVSRC